VYATGAEVSVSAIAIRFSAPICIIEPFELVIVDATTRLQQAIATFAVNMTPAAVCTSSTLTPVPEQYDLLLIRWNMESIRGHTGERVADGIVQLYPYIAADPPTELDEIMRRPAPKSEPAPLPLQEGLPSTSAAKITSEPRHTAPPSLSPDRPSADDAKPRGRRRRKR